MAHSVIARMAELSSSAAVIEIGTAGSMGAEMVVIAVGPGTTLGWVLDAQRALACADRAVASAWLF